MIRKRSKTYIAGESFRFDWKEHEVVEFIKQYIQLMKDGNELQDVVTALAKKFKRNKIEVNILIFDLTAKNYISPKGRGTTRKPFTVID